jgi:hypothetical protein
MERGRPCTYDGKESPLPDSVEPSPERPPARPRLSPVASTAMDLARRQAQDAEEPAGMADRHRPEVPPRDDTAGHHHDHGSAAPAPIPPRHDLVGPRRRPRRHRPAHLTPAQSMADEPQWAAGRSPRRSAHRATPRARSLRRRQLLLPRVDVDVRMNDSLRAPADHVVGARRGESVGERRPSPTYLRDPTACRCSASAADLRRVAQPGPIRFREGEAGDRRAPTIIEADRERPRHPQPARPITLPLVNRSPRGGSSCRTTPLRRRDFQLVKKFGGDPRFSPDLRAS